MQTSFVEPHKKLLRHHESGSTLFEMMVVLVVLGLLAAVVTPMFAMSDERRLRLAEKCITRELQALRLLALSKSVQQSWSVQHSLCSERFRALDGVLSLHKIVDQHDADLVLFPTLETTGGTLQMRLGESESALEISAITGLITPRRTSKNRDLR